MMLNFIDKLGDWNPQLLRELKGRLKIFPVIIAFATSLIGQLVLFLYQLRELPGEEFRMSEKYCLLANTYQQQLNSLDEQARKLNNQLYFFSSKKNFNAEKVQDFKEQLEPVKAAQTNLSKILYNSFCPPDQINMQLWWRDHWEYIFLSLSVVFIFTLLVAGTYLLINDLGKEERRGTLNFIRLSPQSETSILTGKMLGVPILIYLATAAAIPLHLFAGRAANIAFSHIFSFYVVLGASCIFFYSAALLFGLVSRFLSGFQPWLGSGAVLFFLVITIQIAQSNPNHAITWLRFLSPLDMTGYLFPNLFNRYNWQTLEKVQFFYLPIAKSLVALLGVHLINYGLLTFGIWQGLKRRFRNPNAVILTKGQSYLVVAYFQILLWGFTLQYVTNDCVPNYTTRNNYNACLYDLNRQIADNFPSLLIINIVLLCGLLIVLSPQRQDIQDWARYRHQNVSNRRNFWKNSLLQDLIFGDKTPAPMAMLINLVMIVTPLVVWIVLAPALNINHTTSINWLINQVGRFKAILGVALFITMMMIYATIVQRMLLMKTSKRYFWATGTIGAAMFFPPMILGLLGIQAVTSPILWLFSAYPWFALQSTSTTTVFMALLGEFSVLVLLNFQLTRQVKLAGESATKALLTAGVRS